MKRTILSAALSGVMAATTQTLGHAQSSVEYDCTEPASVMEEHADIIIRGNCDSIRIPGNGNTITFENAGEIKIAGNGNTLYQAATPGGFASILWIGGNDNTVAMDSALEIVLAGNNNTVSYPLDHDVDTVNLGDNNELIPGGVLPTDNASTSAPDKSAIKGMSEAEREKLEESSNESLNGSANMTDAELKEAAEESSNESLNGSANMTDAELKEAAEEALNESAN